MGVGSGPVVLYAMICGVLDESTRLHQTQSESLLEHYELWQYPLFSRGPGCEVDNPLLRGAVIMHFVRTFLNRIDWLPRFAQQKRNLMLGRTKGKGDC